MAQEEEICTRVSESVKMAGFLEKKGKMKIMSAWKKYWFVLEERLLLYYRSQIEYINLSPCRGSLNMGLVTTVRPGSSAGPCIIHVITRTQVVQLRAKNRATQEEWLQALLDSMSLPLFSKTLKAPLIADLHGHRYSMDNIPAHDRLRKTESDRLRESRRKNISDSFYGGSLDTVIWAKKLRSPSPNIPKGKMLEKILGYVEEGEVKSASDMVSLIDDDGSTSSRKDSEREKGDTETEKVTKSLSDNELNEGTKAKEESQFERLRNAMRKTREKAFGGKIDLDRKPSTIKKRRQSFLQKVFKRHYRTGNERDLQEDETDQEDPLYDTIDHVQEQKERLTSSASDSSEETKKEKTVEDIPRVEEETVSSLSSTQNQKPVFGSKSILSAQAMSELKTKLKSRESVGSQEMEPSGETGLVPDLPPRRRDSRPRSPWHDVPASTPIEVGEAFTPRGGGVKFHDDDPVLFHDPPPEVKALEETKPRGKESDLTVLLEQLTEITTASLSEGLATPPKAEPWVKERRTSDPDYDVPRPHKLVNLCFSEDGEKIGEIHFLRKVEECSDTSSSFHSIEPDSLESTEKKSLKQ